MRFVFVRTVKALALAGLLAGVALSAQAARAATSSSAGATADIVAPIAISNVDPTGLVFGQIVPTANGTVTIAPDGSRTSTGVQVVPSSLANAAHFQVTGNAANTYSIALPSAITISNGPNNMTVDAFTSTPSGTGTLDGTGKQNVNVGATLRVSNNQAAGRYTGTFTVSVAYN